MEKTNFGRDHAPFVTIFLICTVHQLMFSAAAPEIVSLPLTLDGRHFLEYQDSSIGLIPVNNIIALDPQDKELDFLQAVVEDERCLVAALAKNRLLTFVKAVKYQERWIKAATSLELDNAKFMLRSTGKIVVNNDKTVRIYNGWTDPHDLLFEHQFNDKILQRAFPLVEGGLGIKLSSGSYCSITKTVEGYQLTDEQDLSTEDSVEGEVEAKESSWPDLPEGGSSIGADNRLLIDEKQLAKQRAQLAEEREKLQRGAKALNDIATLQAQLLAAQEQLKKLQQFQGEQKSDDDSPPDKQRHQLLEQLVHHAEEGNIPAVTARINSPDFNPNLYDMRTGRTTLQALLWRLGELRAMNDQQIDRPQDNLTSTIECLIGNPKIQLLGNFELTQLKNQLANIFPEVNVEFIPTSLHNTISVAKITREARDQLRTT